MAEMTPYTTNEGDRWDTIAWKAYGDTSKIKDIAEANPTVPLWPILPAGIKMQIPIMSKPEITKDQLPPWKR